MRRSCCASTVPVVRRMKVALFVVAFAVGLQGTSAGAEASDGLAVPAPLPHGWVVLDARAPDAQLSSGRAYYASTTADGPALSVGTMSCDGGCDALAGPERAVSGLHGGRLVRNGNWAWVTWVNAENDDVGYVVAARDLPDRAVISAARAGKVSNGKLVGVDRTGLPSGLRKLGSFGVAQWGVPFATERVTFSGDDGGSVVDAYTYHYRNAAARAAQRFWSGQSELMAGSPPLSVPALSVQAVGATRPPRHIGRIGRPRGRARRDTRRCCATRPRELLPGCRPSRLGSVPHPSRAWRSLVHSPTSVRRTGACCRRGRSL